MGAALQDRGRAFARAVGGQLFEPFEDSAVAAMLVNQPVQGIAAGFFFPGAAKEKGWRRGQPEVDMNEAEDFRTSPLPQRHSGIVVSSAENRGSP